MTRGPIPVVLLEGNLLRPAFRRLEPRFYLENIIIMVPRPGKPATGKALRRAAAQAWVEPEHCRYTTGCGAPARQLQGRRLMAERPD